jgi:hypothetical protein
VHATLRFADGSVATISYVTDGQPRFPKETLDVAADGRSGRLDNFQRSRLVATGKTSHGRSPARTRVSARSWTLRRGRAGRRAMPIPLDSLVATTRATLAVGTACAPGSR